MLKAIIVIVAAAAAGAYLRWSTRPTLLALRIGRQVERIRSQDH